MAIALDLETDFSSTGTGTTHTFAHTCTGANRVLFVGAVGGNTGSAVDDITGVTYNGVAMSFVNKTFVAADRYRYLYGLIAPATGANNVVITSSTSGGYKGGAAISYTGVNQSGLPDSSATNSATANTLTTSTTVVASNCWTLLLGGVGGATPLAGTGSTMRGTGQVVTWFDSNGVVTTGSQSMTITTSDSGSHPIMSNMLSFAPAGAAVATVSTDKTTQQYLNTKAGTSNLTKQEAINRLAGTTGLTQQEAWNVYAGLTPKTGQTEQQAANVKTASTGLSVQQASSII